MAEARIASPAFPLNKSVSTGTVVTAFTIAPYQPTATKPVTGTETIVVYDQSASVTSALIPAASLLNLVPFSTASNSTSVGIRVTAWRTYAASGGTIYIPTVLYDGTLAYTTTTASIPSVSMDVGTQYFFSGLTSSGWGPSPSSYSPATAAAANTAICTLTVDPVGATMVTVSFKAATNGGTMGVLWNTI